MPRKAARRSKSADGSRESKAPRVFAHSRTIVLLLLASSLLPLAVLFTLRVADVRLGQGYFSILYSPIPGWRLPRAVPAVAAGAFACAAVWALAMRGRAPRVAGVTLFSISVLAMGTWTWWAPPEPVNQHSLNMGSLSTDGAFMMEAMKGAPWRTYVRDFTQTLRMTPEQMSGTRVLSNPPLTTLLAYAVLGAFAHPADDPDWLERTLVESHNVEPRAAPSLAHLVRFSVALMIPWMLSGWAAYLLGR